MPLDLAKRMSAVAPSGTLAMTARAAELKKSGVDVFALSVGEPDFEPSPSILDAAKKAIDRGASKYTAVGGIAELKESIQKATERDRGWSPPLQGICVTTGAKQALFHLAVALYEPGDEVLIPSPYWVTYPEQVRLMGATPVFLPTAEASNWKVSPEDLEKSLNQKTKAFLLCTPSNPTGSAYTRHEIEALASVLRKHSCWIVIDEIYAELVYDGFEHASLAAIAPDLRERIVIIDGVAKTYAMTGWRIGWSLAPSSLNRAIELIQGQSTTHATVVAQHATIAALQTATSELDAIRLRFQKRRDRMVKRLNDTTLFRCRKPEGAFYAFADCRALYGLRWNNKAIENDTEAALWLLEEAHVASVPGSSFGMEGYLRFSYAVQEERIDAAVDSIIQAVNRQKR